jgi:hypothetical protein
MRTQLAALLLSAAVVCGAGALAEDPPRSVQIDGALSANPAQSTPQTATTLRMRGIVDSYEVATRILSLSTSTGTLRFPLSPTARIRQDSQQIDASALQKLAGYRAAVRYSESGGNKAVESVHVFGEAKE